MDKIQLANTCKNCGANEYHEISNHKLKCDYCGTVITTRNYDYNIDNLLICTSQTHHYGLINEAGEVVCNVTAKMK